MNAVLERFLLQQHDERMRTRPPSAYVRTDEVKKAGGAKGGSVARTHCRNGHEYTEANTHVKRNGAKVCRTCQRARDAARVAARREAR